MNAANRGCGNSDNPRRTIHKDFEDQGEYLEKLLRRQQSYLLAAFLDEAADPVEHACLGLRLMGHSQGIKLVVKRSVSRCGGDSQSRINLC